MKQIKLEEKSAFGIQGLHRLSLCDVRDPRAQRLESEILAFGEAQEAKMDKVRRLVGLAVWRSLVAEAGHWRGILRMLKEQKHETLDQMYQAMRTASMVKDFQVHNIIPTAGRAVIARWLIGDDTYPGTDGANWGSLGTSATAVANTDTQLTAETFRKARSSESQSTNVATLSNFYTAAEVTGTFQEAGWHIAASVTPNSGQLLSHFLTGTIVKSATETLIVQSTLTIS